MRWTRITIDAACIVISLLLSSLLALSQEIGAVRLLGQFTPSGGSYVAGCWGWTDTTSGREYALLANTCGTAIVEITNPSLMVERDFIPGPCSSWRELQVHGHYAYVVSEAGGGTQIIDLSYLPDSAHLVKNFIYNSGGVTNISSHTNHIKDGYLYLNGSSSPNGGVMIFSLADPENPAYQSSYTRTYVHDSFVRGNRMYTAAIYGQGVDIVDISNKANPQMLYNINHAGSGIHNTATTVDGKYLLTTDEIGSTNTLKIWDLQSPPSFPRVYEYIGSPTAIVHNVFVKDSLAIMSYYTAGMRVLDISDPTDPVELGGYDSYPANDASAYTGAWSVYPFFPSGRIIVGDMASGMYVLELNLNGPATPDDFAAYSDYQTPTSITLTWDDPTQLVNGGPLNGLKLHIYRGATFIAEVDSGIESYIDSGLTAHSYYVYSIRAVNGADSSSVRVTSAYAGGHAQPKSPTLYAARDGSVGSVLSWINPSRQFDDTPLNDLAYVLIYRDGVLLDSIAQSMADTGQSRTYTDSLMGYHTYSIRVRDNESPTNYSQMTSTIQSFGGVTTGSLETFESFAAGRFLRTGAWDTTSLFSTSKPHSMTDSPFGQFPHSANTSVTLPPVILGSNPILQFQHIAMAPPGNFAWLEISNNQRASFTAIKLYTTNSHSQWADGIADSTDWFRETINLSAYAGDTITVRFRLQTHTSVSGDGWYLDDVYIGSADAMTTLNIGLDADWNMVSLPLLVSDPRPTTLFPSATSPAFAYEAGYASEDSLNFGRGYWVKYPSTMSIPVTGQMSIRDTIDLDAKWNMIGTISASIDTGSIKTIPAGILRSNYFSYDGGYTSVKTLEPGKAYWVKTSQVGKMVFSIYTGKLSSETQTAPLAESGITLRVIDATGRTQTLKFLDEGASLDIYELPPVPPSGAFDIRFVSGRNAEHFTRKQSGYRVSLSGARFPLTISREHGNGFDGEVSLAAGNGKWRLLSGQSIQLTDESVNNLEFEVSAEAQNSILPKQFALGQNYPNPFNPATEIRYQISEASTVSLVVYDVLGKEVSRLVNREARNPGDYRITWDASGMPSGVYYALFTATDLSGRESHRMSRKMVLMK